MYQIMQMTEQVEEKVIRHKMKTDDQHEQKERLDMDKALMVRCKEIAVKKVLEILFGQMVLIIGLEIMEQAVQVIMMSQLNFG